jgi:hypothetical protein
MRVGAFPKMAPVRITFPRPRVADTRAAVRDALEVLQLGDLRGRRIAVTAGSRGIREIVAVLSTVVSWLAQRGAVPSVVAAMGSHGGATADGQRALLTQLGITPESVGAPVLTDMDTVELGRTSRGLVAHCDRNAALADGILVINRIKPHTAFAEPFGSGLLKMLAVGLGKVPGAAQIHRQGPTHMAEAIDEIAMVVMARGKVLGGVALIENAYEETAVVEGIPPARISPRERELFSDARRLMPHLPVDELDILVVDEMGKEYSGTGMDVNVIGRWRLPGMAEPRRPRVHRIVTLRLSAASEGNAQGVGLADVVTTRLVNAIDPVTTYVNNITSTFLERAFIPITMPTDRDALAAALASLGLPDPARARAGRVRNTLQLETMWLSESVLPEVIGRPGITAGDLAELEFTSDGRMADVP